MFNGKLVHFIGIGGISMSGIAYIIHSLGANVTGSNIVASDVTDKLISDGYNVQIGHHPSFAMLIIVNYISALCIKGFYYVKKYLFLYCTI